MKRFRCLSLIVGYIAIFVMAWRSAFATNATCTDINPQRSPVWDDVNKIAIALRDPDKSEISHPENCFQQLTSTDLEFIRSLEKKLVLACSERRGAHLVEQQQCAARARTTWSESLKAYRDLHGSDALERVLVAVNASIKKQQIVAALKTLNDPHISPAFKKFSNKIHSYESALHLAAQHDIKLGRQGGSLESAVVRGRRFFGMSFEYLDYSLDRGGGNRFRNLETAAKDVHGETANFRQAIANSNLSKEKKIELVNHTNTLLAELQYQTIHAQDEWWETGHALQVGASALGSAGLIVASAGAAAPALLSAASGSTQALATSAVAGYAGGAAAVQTGKTATMVLLAKTDSDAKSTRFLCELSRRVGTNAGNLVEETFDAGLHGAAFGIGIGGTVMMAAKALPTIGPLLAALGGLGLVTHSVVGLAQNESQRQTEELARGRSLAELEGKVQAGEATRGELVDQRYQANRARASANAQRISDAATAGAIAVGGVQAVRGLGPLVFDRRTGEIWRAKSRDDIRTPARENFIEANLNYSPISVEANERFIHLAEKMHSDGKTRFGDVENSIMKRLNDTTNDKNLVTSLTNRQKKLLLDELSVMRKRSPGLEIELYSDFKSIRFAAHGKIPTDFAEQIQALLARTDEQFAKEVLGAKLVRNDDEVIGRPETWFRAGVGETADQANLAARAAREQSEGNRLFDFTDKELQANLTRRFEGVEVHRQQTMQALSNIPLRSQIEGTVKETLSREAFDMTRKYGDPLALRDAIRKRFKLDTFTAEQADAMIQYSKAVDEFSPGIHVAKREIVNLDEAEHGGFSVDFLGLGSANQSATAAGLARATHLQDAIVQARLGERQVTAEIKGRIKRFKEIAGDFARCSGDDCVGVALAVMSNSEKRELLRRLAADDMTRGVRLSFVADGVTVKSDRTTLATHGESIEKALRKKLEGVIDHKRLGKAIFAIDMQTKSAAVGNVDLIVAADTGFKWTPQEWRRIEGAFTEAVKHYNQTAAKEGVEAQYKAMKSSCAWAAGTAACQSQSQSQSDSSIQSQRDHTF
jgi:hypothetical protein